MEQQITKAKRYIILINVCVSIFMCTLDASILNIALPIISSELKADISSIQWVVTSYLLTISVLLLIWGKISDIYGRKRVYTFGFIVFTIGSVMCGLSNSLNMLVFSRVLQAMGASSMMALSQGIVTSTFPAAERGKALGITGTIVAMGGLVGPSLGGILVHAAGWEAIFYLNIPIGVLGIILTIFTFPKDDKKPENVNFDYKGSLLYIFSITLLFMALLLWQERSIGTSLMIPMLIAAIIGLVIFIRYEEHAIDPLIHLELFRNKVFSMGVICAYLSFIAIFATQMFVPFYLQLALKLDTLTSGILVSFYPIATALVAPLSGRLSDKISFRPLTVAGLTINVIVLAAMTTLGSGSSFIKIAVLMAALGVGVGLFQSPNNSSVMGAVSKERLGIAGGINALFRNLGMVSGITISVMLFSLTTRMDINSLSGSGNTIDIPLFLKGFRTVLGATAIICAAGAIISLSRALDKRT
ncbi:MAG: EmrB/QacA subfamily drug resistance transporter [Clostridiales bacterium]|nr:EmrB/QacA subfamily drug resistance transporter [Clostridiales bacterium]